jgi:hypothetical protein
MVGNELYEAVGDIVIDGAVVQRAWTRRHRLAKELKDPDKLREAFRLEARVQTLGRRVGFTEIGTYDGIHFVRMLAENNPELTLALQTADFETLPDREAFSAFINSMLGKYFGTIILEEDESCPFGSPSPSDPAKEQPHG